MKVLLDAMLPKEPGTMLPAHLVTHATEFARHTLSNGKLMDACEADGFEALLTKDANMPYQQNMRGRKLKLILLRPRTQDPAQLQALIPHVEAALAAASYGEVMTVRHS